jgi:6-phosphogluconate dehydrogenase
MGGNMASGLPGNGVEVAAFNTSPGKTRDLEKLGGLAAYSLEELVSRTGSPAVVWLVLPSGRATEETVLKLSNLLRRAISS